MADPYAQPQLKAQNLEGLKLDELSPLTPEVISRQATINIGKHYITLVSSCFNTIVYGAHYAVLFKA
jgi:hypothetical protein